jgi:nucleoside-diphosphate-sugar epimerase
MRIFLAGATGAIGRRLLRLLSHAGHSVTGTTRFHDKTDQIAASGGSPAVVDVFDKAELMRAVAAAGPEVVIHQLTDLPRHPDPAAMADALPRNARLRIEGTRNLVEAALAFGARRFVAQSVAFAYAPGPEPYDEEDPLDTGATGARKVTVDGVVELERMVTTTPGFAGIVLRYGRLYGPGTWHDAAPGRGYVHVDAAAFACLLAVSRGPAGCYNIAEDDGLVSVAKARRELRWDPSSRGDAG